MKIDIGHIVYTVAMVLLAFVAALVVTKIIVKYASKDNKYKE